MSAPCPDCDGSVPGVDGLCFRHRGETAHALLAALERLVSEAAYPCLLDPAKPCWNGGEHRPDACGLCQARAAIAKANGGQP